MNNNLLTIQVYVDGTIFETRNKIFMQGIFEVMRFEFEMSMMDKYFFPRVQIK